MDDRIRAGLAEAERIAACYRPSDADLADAPVISSWTLGTVPGEPGVSLIGIVTGHPRLPDGRAAVTSIVLAISVDGGWARTVSRYYRLGRPAAAALN